MSLCWKIWFASTISLLIRPIHWTEMLGPVLFQWPLLSCCEDTDQVNLSLTLMLVTIFLSQMLYISCSTFCSSAKTSNFSLCTYAPKPYSSSFSYIVLFFYLCETTGSFFYRILLTIDYNQLHYSMQLKCLTQVACPLFLCLRTHPKQSNHLSLYTSNLQPSICQVRFVPELFILAVTYFEFKERNF